MDVGVGEEVFEYYEYVFDYVEFDIGVVEGVD